MRRKKNRIENSDPKIKVKLDYRTTITIRSMNALGAWLARYPDAKVIS